MCVCARAYLDESRSQEGEAVFVRLTPLSLSLLSRLHLLTRFRLQCSCILQSPPFRIFVD